MGHTNVVVAPRARATARYAAAGGIIALLCLVSLIGLNASLDPQALSSSFSRLVVPSRQLPSSKYADPEMADAFAYVDSSGQPIDVHELMTPELIAEIKARTTDCLSPPQVHLLWIGDIEKAPKTMHNYTQRGFNLTVHTSADEVLEGFKPFVKSAYRKAVPTVVGHDFLKFAMLYKYGGFAADADTTPAVPASEIKFPKECELLFGKENHLHRTEKPVYREVGGPDYGFSRPFQVLNWAMAASKPRNKHVKWLMEAAMMHFFGLRDMEFRFIQDVSGSGLMTDYVAFLHEREGRSYPLVYEEPGYVPVDGLCLANSYLDYSWIRHHNLGSWKAAGAE